jgi:citrate lyase subunit beta / citryl-CoA lyase
MLRSILFVPADRPDRFAKAAASGADAIAIDLEDSVAPANKAAGRAAVGDYLAGSRGAAQTFVRINPLGSGQEADDIAAILTHPPDAILLPKAEGAASISALVAMLNGADIPILPIATETPAAVFQLGSYGAVAQHLIGLTWGAEDLPAAMGAATSREDDGRFTPPYEMVRSLALIGAHAAGVPAIETVYPNISDTDGLAGYAARARRDGFAGMMAIHPAQVPIIHAGFSPSAAEVEAAQAIIAAFDAQPGAGAIQLNGKMLDRPHLASAQRVLARAGLA